MKTNQSVQRAARTAIARIRRGILKKLGTAIFWNGDYLIFSIEEFILRLHIDEHDERRLRRRDVFMLRNSFKRLCGAYYGEIAFDRALQQLAADGIIKLDIVSDGQASFQTSTISNPKQFYETLRMMREKHDIAEMLEVGRLGDLSAAETLSSR